MNRTARSTLARHSERRAGRIRAASLWGGREMMGRRLLVGAFANVAGKLTSAAVWFLLTPFLLHNLGPTGYGLWVLIGSLAWYGWLLDLGIGGAVVKYVAEYKARREDGELRAVMATAQWLYLGLGASAFLLSVALAPIFPRLFAVAEGDRATAGALVILTGLAVGVAIGFTATTSVLQGLQRYDVMNAIFAAGTLVQAAAVVVVIKAGGGLLGVVAVNIPFELLIRAAHVWAIRRIEPGFRFRWRGGNRQALKRLVSFSTPLFAMDVASRLNFKTDEIVIGAFRALSVIAPYAVARKLSSTAQVIAEQFLKILMPAASAVGAHGDEATLRRLYIVGTRITVAVFVPMALTLIVLGRAILTVWVGPDYAATGSSVVIILTTASLVATSQWPAASVLQGIARHRLLGITSLGTAAANIVLSIVLLRVMGLAGVALATLIPVSATSLFIVMPYAMRTLHVGIALAVREVWMPALLPGIPAALVFVALNAALHPASAWMIAAVSSVGVSVYAIGYLAMAAADVERRTLRRLCSGALRRIAVGQSHA